MSLVGKISSHIRNGTLLSRIRAKVIGKKAETAAAPVGDVYYGECADQYLDKRLAQDYWHLEQDVVEKLLTEFAEGTTVLDVPFGTGRFVPFYTNQKMKIFGLDASEDMIKVAERELGEGFAACDVRVGDAMALPYGDSEFDLGVCFRFLSHIVSYEQACKVLVELRRVCAKHLIVQLRVRREDAPEIDRLDPTASMDDNVDLAGVTQMLTQAGFRIVKQVPLEEREVYSRTVFLCESV